KCKCGPVDDPVLPISPKESPAVTLSPFLTVTFCICAYNVKYLSLCCTCTWFPYPPPQHVSPSTQPSTVSCISPLLYENTLIPIDLQFYVIFLPFYYVISIHIYY